MRTGKGDQISPAVSSALTDLENALIAADGASKALGELIEKNSSNVEALVYLSVRLAEHLGEAGEAFELIFSGTCVRSA
jgi:hypothetical protein